MKHKKTPTSIYLLSGFSILLIVDTILYLMSDASYYYIALILIPIYLYLSIGVFKVWPKVKSIYMILILLLFAGTVSQIIALSISDDLDTTNTLFITRVFLGLSLPPVIYITFRRKEVANFFKEVG